MATLTLGADSSGQVVTAPNGIRRVSQIIQASASITAAYNIDIINPGWDWVIFRLYLTTGGASAVVHTFRIYPWIEAEAGYGDGLVANATGTATLADTATDGSTTDFVCGPGAVTNTWGSGAAVATGPVPAKFRLKVTVSAANALIYSISAHMGSGQVDV